MDHDQGTPQLPPHELIFPVPLQSHVNSKLKLAELFCLAGLHITFVISDYAYGRLQHHANVESCFARYPGFCFKIIPDGLPDDHPRAGERVSDMMMSLKAVGMTQFRELLRSSSSRNSVGTRRPVTFVIGDGVLGFAADIADEFGIPFFYFRTLSSCCVWANFCINQIIEAGELPLNGSSDHHMDLPVRSVPGMESFLRRRDIPGYCRVDNINDAVLQSFESESWRTTARGLILNIFEDLEAPILSQIRTQIPNLYAIGPLHSHLKSRLAAATTSPAPNVSASFWEEDRSCIKWLNAQPPKSVIYVSFGSVTLVTGNQLMEFWHGLVNSGHRFMWLMRPVSVTGEDGEIQIPAELAVGNKESGYIVGWAPQEEVLHHPAVGGFLTHSGWNSTLESIVAGLPMICWPYFADQMINSRFVGEVWKLGLDKKDTCDPVTIEKMVRDSMELRNDELIQCADRMAKLAKTSCERRWAIILQFGPSD